jgi:hypothetical protein
LKKNKHKHTGRVQNASGQVGMHPLVCIFRISALRIATAKTKPEPGGLHLHLRMAPASTTAADTDGNFNNRQTTGNANAKLQTWH